MQLFELDEPTIDRIYQLIIMDQAYRVRISAIKLVLPHLQRPAIHEKLIPALLREATNCNYKVRLTVLFFVQVVVRDSVGNLPRGTAEQACRELPAYP